MNEQLKFIFIPLLGSLFVLLGCCFYKAGGINGKWKRRYLASFILSFGLWIEFIFMGMFKYWLLLIYPLTIGCFCLGYGVNQGEYQTLRKILRRSIVVFASLTSSVLVCVIYGCSIWSVMPVELLCGIVTIYLGTRNPIGSAEEFAICLFLWMPKILYPFAI